MNDLANVMTEAAFHNHSVDTLKLVTNNLKPLAADQVERVYNGST